MPSKETRICTEEEIRDFVNQVAKRTLESVSSPSDLAFVGIRTRGEHLARRILAGVERDAGWQEIPLGILDITLYRDDLDEVASQPVVRKTSLPFNVKGKHLVLVDDVLNTGRSARAALDLIIDFGRPKVIKLAVMVDRGMRELPIHADYVGKTITPAEGQDVQVRLKEVDGKDEVVLIDMQ